MQVTIDKAGRVVVPKRIRDELGFSAGVPLELEVVDGHMELAAPQRPIRLIEGPHGPSVAPTGTPLDDGYVRRTLEAVRERQ